MDDLSPTEFYLFQNYPNPFKEKTTIKYCIAYKTKVRLTVFNSKGDLMEKLVDEEKEAGTYKVNFDASELSSGIYYYKIESGNFTSVKKMILLK